MLGIKSSVSVMRNKKQKRVALMRSRLSAVVGLPSPMDAKDDERDGRGPVRRGGPQSFQVEEDTIKTL